MTCPIRRVFDPAAWPACGPGLNVNGSPKFETASPTPSCQPKICAAGAGCSRPVRRRNTALWSSRGGGDDSGPASGRLWGLSGFDVAKPSWEQRRARREVEHLFAPASVTASRAARATAGRSPPPDALKHGPGLTSIAPPAVAGRHGGWRPLSILGLPPFPLWRARFGPASDLTLLRLRCEQARSGWAAVLASRWSC